MPLKQEPFEIVEEQVFLNTDLNENTKERKQAYAHPQEEQGPQ